MHLFRDIPFQQKLTATIVLAVGAALLSSGLGVMVVDQKLFRRSLDRELAALAQMTAENTTAALVFDDAKTAGEILAALKAKPHMVAACVHRKDGTVLARYARPDAPAGCPPPASSDDVVVRKAVLLNNRQVGSLVLVYDPDELYTRRTLYGGIVAILMLASAGVALVISSQLQKAILSPIAYLTTAAKSVSETKDYGIRAQKVSGDELGYLSDAFNEMLSNIQSRDAELLQAREELEHRVQARTQELARSNADLQQFAYVASHDLQEPLRMVISYLQILADRYRGRLDADADEFIGYAVDGGYRMRQLITDLLEYSRVGTRSQWSIPSDLNAILDDVRANLDLSIRESDAEITYDPPLLPTIMADPTHMVQLFQNLLANAIKFRKANPARIRISAQRGDGEWRMSIADQGIGIRPEYRESIFEIFRRLHDRMEYAGTGIGLAVCKKLLTRLGGKIWVESEEGQGATFFFTLPDAAPSNGVKENEKA